MYRVEVAPAAGRDLDKLAARIGSATFDRMRHAIAGLAVEPRPAGCRKIRGAGEAYRLRVGDYRVIYDIHDENRLVVLLRVLKRDEATYG